MGFWRSIKRGVRQFGSSLGGLVGIGGRDTEKIGFEPTADYNYDANSFNLGGAGTGQFGFDTAQQNQFRDRQMTLADQLALQAQGQGPSVVDAQANQARQSLFSQGLSGVASQRSGNSAMSQRNLLNALAQGNQQIGAEAGIQRMQEQTQARDQLASVLQGGRGQDIGVATTMAQGDLASRLYQLQSQQELQKLRGADVLERDRIRFGVAQANANKQAANRAGLAGLIAVAAKTFGGGGGAPAGGAAK